jgi:hypothetical protein
MSTAIAQGPSGTYNLDPVRSTFGFTVALLAARAGALEDAAA